MMNMPLDFESAVWLYCSALAAAIPVLIPALQFGIVFRLWDQYNKPVNRDYCQCSCWDTVFKGKKPSSSEYSFRSQCL